MVTQVLFFDIFFRKYPHLNTIENPILMDVDINKIIVSNKVSCKKRYKHFIGYKNYEKVILLCITFAQMSPHARNFHESKCLCFLIDDAELLGKNIIKFGIQSAIILKMILIRNLGPMKIIPKLK